MSIAGSAVIAGEKQMAVEARVFIKKAVVDAWQLVEHSILASPPPSDPAPTKREAALQAKIDALMLECCPDEMTPEQMANWAAHQRPAPSDPAGQKNAAPQESGSESAGTTTYRLATPAGAAPATTEDAKGVCVWTFNKYEWNTTCNGYPAFLCQTCPGCGKRVVVKGEG